jgi:chromosomal replication initiator protein
VAQAVYLSAEQFTSLFLEALHGGTGLPSFRRKYRGVGLLLIDDVQFFAGKKATVLELLHTIDTLTREGRQLVLAADRAPAELTDLGPELINRLQGGLVCRIDPPDYETRLGIVRQMAIQLNVPAPDEVYAFIASHLTNNARELAGALKRLHVTSQAHQRSMTLSLAEDALSEMIRHGARSVRLADIERAVCQIFGLEADSLQSQRKGKHISHPRMLAMWLARKHTRSALAEIGHYFGRRSHSTVISAQKKVETWMAGKVEPGLTDSRLNIEDAIRRVEECLMVG